MKLLSQRTIASTVFAVLMALGFVGNAAAQTILQGYTTDQTLQRGMLVTVNADDSSKIEAITDKNLDKLKGVVVDSNDSPVTLSTEGQKTFVATSGKYEVLISNENGQIKVGDYISGSSLAGIGMKANDAQSVILGRATTAFEGGGDSIGKTTNANGSSVDFGRITVDIGIGSNPQLKPPASKAVPGALKDVANEITGKEVSSSRVYMALLMFIIATLVAAATLFSGVRSTIISVGRNPLSKGAIYKGLIQITFLSVIIFITGLFGVYLLIKL